MQSWDMSTDRATGVSDVKRQSFCLAANADVVSYLQLQDGLVHRACNAASTMYSLKDGT